MDECDDFLLQLSSESFLLADNVPIDWGEVPLQPPAPDPSTTTTSSISRGFKPLKGKRTRRTELRLLREEVAQLSSLRESLVSRCHDGKSPAHELKLVPLLKTEDSEWKLRADDQLQLREHAMRENLRLRSQLASIAELGERLQRQLKHQESHLQAHESDEASRQVQTKPLCLLQVAHVPHAAGDLILRTQRLYGRTRMAVDDRRLQEDPLATCVRDIQRSPMQDKIDVFDARVVPFDLRATADAIWDWILRGSDTFPPPSDQNAPHGDTVQQSFAGEVVVDATRLRCHGCVVFRRFEEQDRVVFVMTARAYVDDSSSMVYHSQWIVVTRPRLATTTALASCSEIVCRDLSELLGVTDESELAHVVTVSVEDNRERMNAFVDTKLILAARQ